MESVLRVHFWSSKGILDMILFGIAFSLVFNFSFQNYDIMKTEIVTIYLINRN